MPPWLAAFMTAYAGQALGYLAIAGLLLLLPRRWVVGWLARRRIAVRGRALDGAQLRRELGSTLIVLAVGTAQALLISALQEAGSTRLSTAITATDLPGAIVAFSGLLLFNDLWFYGVHRLLHTPWLFKHIHAVHHRSVDVNPLSSYAFHAAEAVLVTGWILPAVLLVPLPLPVLVVVQGVGLANNLMAHLGYELLPVWWLRVPLLRWSNTATFHSLHHTRYKGNYGLLTRLWDRLLGTELSGYEAAFDAAHSPGVPIPSAPARGAGVP